MRDSKDIGAALAKTRSPVRVIYLASYLPRKCGIATFTKDLTTAINNVNPDALAEIIAMNDEGQEYEYPWEVKLRVGQHEAQDYKLAAQYINQSSADIVCLQHEFGIFGGPEGDYSTCLSAGSRQKRTGTARNQASRFYLLELLETITKPVVTTFHTILPDPDPQQMYTMKRIIDRSAAVVAMTEDARKVLIRVYGCPPEKAVVIYHGVPDFNFNNIALYKRKLRIKATPMILCAGLIGPGKGLEYAIDAMPKILQALPTAKLYIVGQTHPVILRNDGEIYRESLMNLVRSLHLSRSVQFVNKYLSDDDLHHYFQAADFFVTAYKNLEQSGSGMLAWGLGAGKVCISTPYHYAADVLSGDAGVLIPANSSGAIADNVIAIYGDQKRRLELRKNAYEKGRKFTWPNVGLSYLNLFQLVIRTAPRSLRRLKALRQKTSLIHSA